MNVQYVRVRLQKKSKLFLMQLRKSRSNCNFREKINYHKTPENLAKQGVSGQIKEKQNNDKNTFHLPRHSSFTINHTFANLGNTGHNMAQTLVITTVSTTKAHGGRARVAGEIGHIP